MKLISDIIEYARIFISYAGFRLLFLFVLVVLGGLFEAISLALLMPMLSLSTSNPSNDPFTNTIEKIFSTLDVNPTLGLLLSIFVIVIIIKSILMYSQKIYSMAIQNSIRCDLQVKITKLLGDMNYSYFTSMKTGYMNNVLMTEVMRFLAGFIEFTRMPVSIAYIAVYFSTALVLRADLSLIIFFAGLISALSLKKILSKTRSLSLKVTESAGILQNSFIEYLHNIIYLKATASTEKAVENLKGEINALASTQLRVGVLSSLLAVLKEPIAIAFLALLVFYQVEVEHKSINEVLVVGILLYRMIGQILQVQGEWQRFNSNIGGVIAIPKIISNLEKNIEGNGKTKVSSIDGEINFHDVSVKHGDMTILSDINLSIKPNELIGIVGSSGAGKTTFFNLICGLLEPSKGNISLGEYNYADLDKKSLRKNIGYVTQEPVIFNDSIENNIAFGNFEPSDDDWHERVKKSLILSHCDEFVSDVKLNLGERGNRLSGGQRQRIAIARELFKDPSLLIFDEATSSLDSHSEKEIQKNINEMKGGRTIILITHRLSTVRRCDRIYVFSEGKIVETGKFDDLYKRDDSLFKEMCVMQNLTMLS